MKPFELAVRKVLPLVEKLKNKYALEFFSLGGGIGIIYKDARASGSPEWWQTPSAKRIITPAMYAVPLRFLIQLPQQFLN